MTTSAAAASSSPTAPAGPFAGWPSLPKTVSVSQLGSFEECSQKWFRTRVLGDLERDPDTIFTRLGGICHEAIEACVQSIVDGDGKWSTPYEALVGEGGVWDRWLKESNLMALKPRLEEYAHVTTQLYYRASAAYKGEDKIRTTKGEVPKAASFTTPFKEEAKKHGLGPKESFINETARRSTDKHGNKQWADIDLADCYAQTAGILWPYRHPEKIASVVAIELGISDVLVAIADENGQPLYEEDGSMVAGSKRNDKRPHVKIDANGFVVPGPDAKGREVYLGMTNPFPLPKLDAKGKLVRTDAVDEYGRPLVYERRDDVFFNGYIDMLGRDKEDRLGVADHKSSMGPPPAPAKVARHEQLLVYGLMVELIFGEVVEWIGINWLRAPAFVQAKFERAKAEEAMERLLSIFYNGMDKMAIMKQHPDAYHTHCVRKASRDNDPPILCSGLKGCHPEIYEYMRRAGAA